MLLIALVRGPSGTPFARAIITFSTLLGRVRSGRRIAAPGAPRPLRSFLVACHRPFSLKTRFAGGDPREIGIADARLRATPAVRSRPLPRWEVARRTGGEPLPLLLAGSRPLAPGRAPRTVAGPRPSRNPRSQRPRPPATSPASCWVCRLSLLRPPPDCAGEFARAAPAGRRRRSWPPAGGFRSPRTAARRAGCERSLPDKRP